MTKDEANADTILRRHGHDLPWNRGPGRDTWNAGIRAVVESAELEREACIAILEDMRPRNDQSDWNEFTVTTDTILRLAIEAINRRYPS